jgi:hypothetical protein
MTAVTSVTAVVHCRVVHPAVSAMAHRRVVHLRVVHLRVVHLRVIHRGVVVRAVVVLGLRASVRQHVAWGRQRGGGRDEALRFRVETGAASAAAEPVALTLVVAVEAGLFGFVLHDDVRRHDRADGEVVVGCVQCSW